MPKGRMSPFSGKMTGPSKGRTSPFVTAANKAAAGVKAGLSGRPKRPNILPGSGSGRAKPKIGGRGYSTQ